MDATRSDASKPVILGAFASNLTNLGVGLRNVPLENQDVGDALGAALGICDWQPLPAAHTAAVFDAFRRFRHRVAVFHFAGHADGYHLFLESADRDTVALRGDGFAGFLGLQTGLRLVFLNGCATAGHAQRLRAAGVPAVVATSAAISDGVARAFAENFYKSLATGATIGRAFAEAARQACSDSGGDPRHCYVDGRQAAPTDDGGWPWVLTGTDEALETTLAEIAGDPYFGLPDLPRDIGLDPLASPFRGFEPFGRAQARVFFGRGADLRALYRTLTDEHGPPVLLLYGQSGVGKSSLLEAGLLPRLESGGFQVRYVRMSHGADATAVIHAALPIHEDLRSSWSAEERRLGRPLVFILDQAEEATREASPDELSRFCQTVARAFADPAGRPSGRLVLSFRKEALAEIEDALRAAGLPISPSTKAFIRRLDRSGVSEAIRLSKAVRDHFRLHIDDHIPSAVSELVLKDPDAPVGPTLQILLSAMWQEAIKESSTAPRFSQLLLDGLLRANERLDLETFFNNALAEVRKRLPEAVDSGLALDVLHYHTRGLEFAERRSAAQCRETYSHRRDLVEQFVGECRKPPYNLLVDDSAERDDREASTRLAHDTLAPLVCRRFQASGTPGQRARSILEYRAAEWEGGRRGNPLGERDLRIVDQGSNGMRVFTPDERRLVRSSERRYVRRYGLALLILFLSGAGPVIAAEVEAGPLTDQRPSRVALKATEVLAGLAVVAVGGVLLVHRFRAVPPETWLVTSALAGLQFIHLSAAYQESRFPMPGGPSPLSAYIVAASLSAVSWVVVFLSFRAPSRGRRAAAYMTGVASLAVFGVVIAVASWQLSDLLETEKRTTASLVLERDGLAEQIRNLQKLNRPADAIPLAVRLIELDDLLYSRRGSSVLGAYKTLMFLYRDAGDLVAAEHAGEERLDVARQLEGPNGSGAIDAWSDLEYLRRWKGFSLADRARVLQSEATNSKAIAAANSGKISEALALEQNAWNIRRELFGADSLMAGVSLGNLGLYHLLGGQYAEAESQTREAVAIETMRVGRTHPLSRNSLAQLARVLRSRSVEYEAAGDIARALDAASEASSLNAEVFGSESQWVRYSSGRLRYLGRLEEIAEPGRNELRMAAELERKSMNGGGLTPESQAQSLRQALEIRTRLLGQGHPVTEETLASAVVASDKAGDYGGSESLRRQFVAMRTEVLGANHPDTLAARQDLEAFLGRRK